MHILAMFDEFNREKLINKLSTKTKEAVEKRMADGMAVQYIMF
jgi:hypothetical protein